MSGRWNASERRGHGGYRPANLPLATLQRTLWTALAMGAPADVEQLLVRSPRGPPAASVSSKALPFCCASIAFLSKAMPFRAVL
eukprot:SAG22_NODE_6280_length_875_cov_1.471649_1_plen_83_part_10